MNNKAVLIETFRLMPEKAIPKYIANIAKQADCPEEMLEKLKEEGHAVWDQLKTKGVITQVQIVDVKPKKEKEVLK